MHRQPFEPSTPRTPWDPATPSGPGGAPRRPHVRAASRPSLAHQALRVSLAATVALLTILLLVTTARGEQLIAPRLPTDLEIDIDGEAREWEGRLETLPGNDVEVGAIHDEDALYLCLVFEEAALRRQILAHGLALEVTPSENADTRILQHPVAVATQQRTPEPGARPTVEELRDRFRAHSAHFRWIHPDGSTMSRELVELDKTEVATDLTRDALVYEIRIPLDDGTWGADARPGETIGIRLLTTGAPTKAPTDEGDGDRAGTVGGSGASRQSGER